MNDCVYTLDEIKAIIKPIATDYEIPAVYVFGSYARAEATENSDVDILIDKTGSKIKTLFDMSGLYVVLREKLKKEVDLITTYALSRDNKDGVNFESEVMKERIAVYER